MKTNLMEQQQNKLRRVLEGTVVGDKMDKTVTVLVTRRVKHPLYGKYITKTTKIHAHDKDNSAVIGDVVTIGNTRPLSKTKFFEVLSIKSTKEKQ